MFRRLISVLLLSVFLVCVPGCNKTTPSDNDHDADDRAIQQAETQWNDDFAAKNIGRLMDHYSRDAVVISPGGPVSTGSEVIRRALEQLVDDPAFALNLEPSKVEVASSGDLAYTLGSYALTVTDPHTKQPVHNHGSYVTTYRKQTDGAWKAVANIATLTTPAAPSPEINSPPPAASTK